MSPATATTLPSGIAPLDARLGGLERGGSYLIAGAPGPAKMVAALQFLYRGVSGGEPGLLVTNADADGILQVARAWGFDMVDAWRAGTLQIVGFREDFELRAIRSIEPGEVVEELQALVGTGTSRIAVDPGAMFLSGGAKTLLGSAFMRWAADQEATVVSTLSVDGGAASLPSSADWLVHATTARLLLERESQGRFQLTISSPVPDAARGDTTITLELKPGEGLVEPGSLPARRGVDRGAVDGKKLLLVSLDDAHARDLEMWARGNFETDVVSEPFDAVTRLQSGPKYGGVLIHAARKQVRAATQACRALRPLTRAAIVFASDDAVRSTDRVNILEAGADDCLSGGLDFRELGLRLKQSIAAGAKVGADARDANAFPDLAPTGPDGGRVAPAVFEREIRRRAADPALAYFCVLDVEPGDMDGAQLEETLVEQVRDDEGDLVSSDGRRCIVLLQGARAAQLGPFLARLPARLAERAGGDAAEIEIGVLSHPADSARIKALVETFLS